ncbi:MAG: cobalamin B12-binding domain-containing protein [Planctomycetota bacterium]
MNDEIMVERLFQTLITGDRQGTRRIVQETQEAGLDAQERALTLYWPVLEMVSALFRADQLTVLAHHYATRLLRSLVTQAQAHYEQGERRGRKILLFSGPGETDELAGQLVADIAEADGYEVFFGGGGVANDEILSEVGDRRPDILLMFASAPGDAPNIRLLIDTIRGVGACPEMQIVVGGGVFNRAEGLAEEIGADMWARDPGELLERLTSDAQRRATADQRTVGRNRRSSGTRRSAAA